MKEATSNSQRIERDGRRLLLSAGAAECVVGALLDHEASTALPGGRGTARLIEFPEGRVIVRRYRRGGAMRWLGERYLANRPKAEFEVLQQALTRGLAVSPPLGVMWRRSGIFYTGALATAWVEGEDLDAWLRLHTGEPASCEVTLRACGAEIRRMHEAGIYHADLQVKNIRIGPGGPVLLDFDNATVSASVSPLQRARNLLRFRRSLEKNGLHRHYFDSLCAGYGAITLPRWLQSLYRIKGRVSDVLGGR